MTAAAGEDSGEGALHIEIADGSEPGEDPRPVWLPPSAHSWYCDVCAGRIDGAENRVVRKYCSNKCRQRAYRERTGRR